MANEQTDVLVNASTIQKIADMAGFDHIVDRKQTAVITASGNKIVIEKPCGYVNAARLGTVEALCDFVKANYAPEKTKIIVSPTGCSATHNIEDREWPKIEEDAGLPFFGADLPPSSWMSHEALLDYLDQHTGKISAKIAGQEISEESILESLKTINAYDKSTFTSRDTGNSIAVEMTAAKGIEPFRMNMPREITINLRRGTREFAYDHTFRLKMKMENGGSVLFRLIHLGRDGAEDSFLFDCISKIKAALGDGWLVLQGA